MTLNRYNNDDLTIVNNHDDDIMVTKMTITADMT